MGDKPDARKGWSRILPSIKGWFEAAEEEQIESPHPAVTRVWSDGAGGLWAPVWIPLWEVHRLRIPRRQVKHIDHRNHKAVVFLPIQGGSFRGTYFRAVGPLLDPSVPLPAQPRDLPRFQRPETYMSPSQRREAREIEAKRKKRKEENP